VWPRSITLPSLFQNSAAPRWPWTADHILMPSELTLWLLGLDIGMTFNPPRRPQNNGVLERSQGTGKRWRDLAGLREAAARANRPTEERLAGETLWADVAAFLKEAEEKAAREQQLVEAGQLAQRGLGLSQEKKWAEAEPLLRQSLDLREKKEPDAWTTFNRQ